MDEKRRGELAVLVLEQVIFDKGLPGGKQLKHDAGNLAKRIGNGVTAEELLKFYQTFVPGLLGNIFGVDHVSLTMANKPSKVDNHHDH